MDITIEDLMNMELHAELCLDSLFTDCLSVKIVRVPGGWIYTTFNLDSNIGSSVFVPKPELKTYTARMGAFTEIED